MEIIPVINCHDEAAASELAKRAGEFSEWVHLDVSDARFTFNKSWGDASAWPKFGKNLNLEVHLMIEEPEKEIDNWINAGAKRIVIHAETTTAEIVSGIKKKTNSADVKLMIAINPETPAEKLRLYFDEISEFQILAVYPGPSGQKFRILSVDKIKFLRQQMPNATIEVDGGINEEMAKLVKDAGADIAVSASYIFGSPDPKSAYEKLKSI